MIVIQHVLTQERFMYPSTNTNVQTATGFIQVQDTPPNFIIATDQTPVPLHYHNRLQWEAESKDPVDTRDRKYY